MSAKAAGSIGTAWSSHSRLVFPSGAKVKDASGLLEGDYADGRRLAMFQTGDVPGLERGRVQGKSVATNHQEVAGIAGHEVIWT
jgi:hypothetical protein